MKWLVLALVVTLVFVGLMAVVGAALPKSHKATRRVRIPRPAAEIFSVISDVSAQPAWRGDVKSVELLPESEGRRVWREKGSSGAITFQEDESIAPSRRVTRIADPTLPFGGTWTFELRALGPNTEVVVTEQGEVRNPIFRFLSRFVFGHATSLERYLAALARQFGEDAKPTP